MNSNGSGEKNGQKQNYFTQQSTLLSLPAYISDIEQRIYVGWKCDKYALLTQIILFLSLFHHCHSCITVHFHEMFFYYKPM